MKKSIKTLLIICMALFLTIGLIACTTTTTPSQCEHSYDNACDTTCNLCSEERSTNHDWSEATCTTPKTCTACGQTEGEALGHDPDEDDGNCTTPTLCSQCDEVLTPAENHDFSGEYQKDADGHWQVCQNEGCTQSSEKQNHEGGIATPTELAVCEKCSEPYGELAIPQITGIVIKNTNSDRYDADTKTFTVSADGEGDLPVLEMTGKYLSNVSYFDYLNSTWSAHVFNTLTIPLVSGYWIIEKDTAFFEVPSSWLYMLSTTPFEIKYTNDNGETWIPTGYYLAIEESTPGDVELLEKAILKGGLVTLTQDLVLSRDIKINTAGDTTIDLNGYSITETGTGCGLFSLYHSDAKLTIMGSGILSANQTVPLYVEFGTLVIEQGVTINAQLYNEENNWYVIVNMDGRVIINGGTFISGTSSAVASDGICEINGGTFTSDPSAYVNAQTHKVTQNDDNTWTVEAKPIITPAPNVLFFDVSIMSAYTFHSGLNVHLYDENDNNLGLAEVEYVDGVYIITQIPEGTVKIEFFELFAGKTTGIITIPDGYNTFVLDGNVDENGNYTGTWTVSNEF